METKNSRKIWAIVIAIIVLVIAIIVAFLIGKGLETEKESASQSEPNLTKEKKDEPSDTHSDNGEKWMKSDSDVFGRSIKVPRNGAGNPLTDKVDTQKETCDTPDSQQVTIQSTHLVQTLWSETSGPSSNEDSIPGGYARSPEGAMLAAWNSNVLFQHGGDLSKPLLEKSFTGEKAREELKSISGEEVPTSEGASDMPAPSAYRVTSCDDSRVIGDLAVPFPTDKNGDPDKKSWGILRVSAVWENGDWKTELDEVEQPVEEEISNLDGWSRWEF